MRHERQMEILERVASAGPRMKGLQGPKSYVNPAEVYTSAERFELEQQLLFRENPVFFAMSGELPNPGDYQTGVFGGVSIVVIRQKDGSVKAMVNACRHRGAPLVEPGTAGSGLSALTCPYHAWTYELNGALRAQPASAGAFDDVDMNCDLHDVAVTEHLGMIFVRPMGGEPIDGDAVLDGAQTDLADFNLAKERAVESRVFTWDLNWKLILDTFMETYHIRTLHRNTIGPYFNSDCLVHDPFGQNMAATAFRKNILDEMDKPRAERTVLPYATVQYFILPNALLVYQIDHWETWRIEPLSLTSTRTTTTIYSPETTLTDEIEAYLSKNLDILLQVIATEDFPLMEQIQANLHSGALPEIVYGRNEPTLTHFHRSLNQRLGV
ncbi:MAG: aromatic ring-hydroxylating dioxygenase subunit alpha [Actinomycetota bacterium]